MVSPGLLRTVLALAGFSLLTDSAAESSKESLEHHAYCIIGAGPAGLQLGHFFKHAGRDYVIFERSARAGSFFRRYPRHRNLISLNKRRVREGRSADFALRHDWNSLLDVREEDDKTLPVTERSKLLFPRADVLAEYLVEYAEEQAPHIRYETTVKKVRRAQDQKGFVVTVAKGAVVDGNWPPEAEKPDSGEVSCGEVVLATGFWRPKGGKVKVDGAKHLVGYEDLPSTGEAFEGKSVIVMGLGNAAMETAQELQKYTAELHIFARERPLPGNATGVRFAYETHYVGDIRAGRTNILDTYLLKSLDTFDYNALQGAKRVVVIPCQGKRFCVWTCEQDDCADQNCKKNFRHGGQDLNYRLDVGRFVANSTTVQQVREALSRFGPEGKKWKIESRTWTKREEAFMERVPEPGTVKEIKARRKNKGIDEAVFQNNYEELMIQSSFMRKHPEVANLAATIRSRYSMDNIRFPMDAVIRCFGWAMDVSILHESVPVNTSHGGKYPMITPGFQLQDVPGVYVAGTLSHSLDFRRSAGGFIHGFRYTARALFRLFEEKNEGVEWPHDLIPLHPPSAESPGPCKGLDTLVEKLRIRINSASGPYQMFQALGDMVVFEADAETGVWSARYMEEVPLELFHKRYHNASRLTWVFRYGEGFYGKKVLSPERVGATSAENADMSNFLHPHLAFVPGGAENSTRGHWQTEDIFTFWSSEELYISLAKFVARVVADATGVKAFAKDGAFSTFRPEPLFEDGVLAGSRPHSEEPLTTTAAPQEKSAETNDSATRGKGSTQASEASDIEKEMAMLQERQQMLERRLNAIRSGRSEL